MNAKTIAVDLAKDVFEVAESVHPGRISARCRLSREQFKRHMHQQAPACVVMEACGSAHYWGRLFESWGYKVKLLPAHQVKAYRKRKKTDRADAAALLEAERCDDLRPVPVKSVEQQNLQHLHRLREQWKRTRTGRINTLRAILREHGVVVAEGAKVFLRQAAEQVDAVPPLEPLRPLLHAVLAEISLLEDQIEECEKQLSRLTKSNAVVQQLQQVAGIGLLTSTALVAAVKSPEYFRNGRQLSAWLGVTPNEFSSGRKRKLGSITGKGNCYLRMLFIHGARAAMQHAKRTAKNKPEQLTRLQRWALELHARVGQNRAVVALANKMIRIAWAVWKHARQFDGNYVPVALAA